MRAMREVQRIAKPDAEVIIVTPHYSSPDSYTDPTHLHHLGLHTFDYFERDSFENFTYGAGGFQILERSLNYLQVPASPELRPPPPEIARALVNYDPAVYTKTGIARTASAE